VAISIVKTVDVQTGTGVALRKIYISGVNSTPGTGENVAHGLGGGAAGIVAVIVAPTVYAENAYEAPTTYLEVEASRTDTNLVIASLGTQSTAKGTVYVWYNVLGDADDAEDAGEEVL
jgi:hypothetical protein